MFRLLDARVFHVRLRPRENRFHYGALYVVLPLSALMHSGPRSLFSVDRVNLFSIRTADYGDGVTPLRSWIRNVLKTWNVAEADGDVWLVTMPRIFGYAFNPVSFWLCFDTSQRLRAVVAEVNNTFRERHSYLCLRDDRGPVGPQDILRCRKVFHVSPFIKVEGEYRFRVTALPGQIAVAIDLSDERGVLLRTSVGGRTVPLTSVRLLYALLRNPLHPLKVIALINYQAAKLFLKGIPVFGKPVPPEGSVSH